MLAISLLATSCDCNCNSESSHQTMVLRDMLGDTIVMIERIPSGDWSCISRGIKVGHEYYCGNITMVNDTNESKGVHIPKRSKTQTIILYSELGDTLQILEHVEYSDWELYDCGVVKVGHNFYKGTVAIIDEDCSAVVYKPTRNNTQKIIMYDPLGDTINYIDSIDWVDWHIKDAGGQLIWNNTETFCGTFAIIDK